MSHLLLQATVAVQGKRGLRASWAAVEIYVPTFASLNQRSGGVGRILVVRVCVVAPPMALCGTTRGCLVADRVTVNGRPPIRGVCVVALPPVRGVGGLSLGLCSPPWMAVMEPGSALAVVWWIMMMVVVLSLSEERKGTNIYVGWSERIPNLRADVTAQTCGLVHCRGTASSQWHLWVNTTVWTSLYISSNVEQKRSPRWFLDPWQHLFLWPVVFCPGFRHTKFKSWGLKGPDAAFGTVFHCPLLVIKICMIRSVALEGPIPIWQFPKVQTSTKCTWNM